MEQEGRSYSGERFRALALYLASRSLDDPAFDKDRLANLLYHCDFIAYARLGDSITGATYKNLPRGPYPECLDKELSHIEEMGEGIVMTADHPEAGVKRLVARNSTATATFAEPEVSIIEQVLEGLRKREASASDQPTHVESICQYVDEGEAIPYTLVFVSTEPPSPEAICVAQEVAERLGRVARAG